MAAWEGGSFNPEDIAVMKSALDDAWEALSKDQRARFTPAELAKRIIKLARRGELDPDRLRMFATTEVVSRRAPPAPVTAPDGSAPSTEDRILIHRRNIERYQKLLKTELSPVEHAFVERRIAEEEALIQSVGTKPGAAAGGT
jgi:hypothetical protein